MAVEAFDRHVEALSTPPKHIEESLADGQKRIEITQVASVSLAAGSDAEEESDVQVQTWRIWFRRPDRVRLDLPFGSERMVTVQRGSRVWTWSPATGGRIGQTSRGRVNFRPAGPLLDGSQLLDAPARSFGEPARWRGREVIRVVGGRPVGLDEPDHPFGWFARGADEVVGLFDPAAGFLVRAEARLRDATFEIFEFTELALEAPVADEVFELELPAGERFEPVQRAIRVTVGELPAQVPFTVFRVSPLPDPRHVTVKPADHRRGIPLTVLMHYWLMAGDSPGPLWLEQSGTPSPAPPAHIDHDNWTDHGEFLLARSGARCKLRFVLQGTHIHIESAVTSLDELIGYTRSLEPIAP